MPKPTLIQSLLGRPSQTYSFPQQKEYHSSRPELIRIATTTRPEYSAQATFHPVPPPTGSTRHSMLSEHASVRVVPDSNMRPPSRASEASTRSVHFEEERAVDSDLLPDRSFIRQIASSHTLPSAQHGSSYINSHQHSTLRTDLLQVDNPHEASHVHRDGDAAEDDMFYTPHSSGYSSPRASRSSTLVLLDSHALANALLPLHSAAAPPELDTTVATPVSRTPSDSSISSSSSDHDETGSLFSSSCATTSTRITSPLSSDHSAPKSDEDIVEAITIVSSSRRSRPASPLQSSPPCSANHPEPDVPAVAAVRPAPALAVEANPHMPDLQVQSEPPARPRPVSMSSFPSNSMEDGVKALHRRSQAEARMTMYTDEDWAKDVKVSSAKGSYPCSLSPRRPLHPDLLPPISGPPNALSQFLEPPSAFPQATPRPRTRSKSDRSSRHSQRRSRARMSALWEEDESEYSTAPSSCEPSRAPTPVHFTESLHSLTPPSTAPSSPGPLHPLFLSNTNPMDKYMQSEEKLLDESPDSMLQDYARLRGQLRSRPSSPVHSPLSVSESSVLSSSLPTYSIPAPFPGSTSTSPLTGYTSLTLPHANYVNKKGKALGEGKVDLVRAGVAQSSMATIEVVRGASLAVRSRPASRHGFSLSISLGLKSKKPERRRSVSRKESATPAHLRGSLPLPVAFTSHIPPPSFCPPSHVLVQVFAVALDGLDSLLVQEKADAGAGPGSGGSLGRNRRAGFIPGRSFVGRAMECGFEVKDEVCKRGEWVVGLLDVRKCGALAEFILVERHRVFRSPQPSARPTSLFSHRRRKHARTLSLPTSQHPAFTSSPLAPPAPLSLEELALLPVVGLAAHRAVRTFADVLSVPRTRDLESRPRMLILQGHDGPGGLAVQLLARKGVRVSVQVPESAVCDIADASTEEASQGHQDDSRRQRVEARIRAWGAEEICVGSPLEVLERFTDESRSIDAILDTVGGVAIWEAAQRMLLLSPSAATAKHASKSSPTFSVLHSFHHSDPDAPEKKSKYGSSQAQFTTLVGDTSNRAIPKAQDNLKSGLRSLRRAMTPSAQTKTASSKVLGDGKKSVKRTVGYTWVSVAADVDFEGEDVRDTLAAVVSMVEDGVMRPWAGLGDVEDQEMKVLPFERAPDVFRRDAAGPLGVLKDGGTCVIKISD